MDEIDRQARRKIGMRINKKNIYEGLGGHISRLRERQEFNEWANNAMCFYYDYQYHTKGFFTRLIQENFSLCKHILRQIGLLNSREILKNKREEDDKNKKSKV